MVDLRILIPATGVLAQHHSVNELAAKTIAAAFLKTSIEVEIDVPQMRDAASDVHVGYRVA